MRTPTAAFPLRVNSEFSHGGIRFRDRRRGFRRLRPRGPALRVRSPPRSPPRGRRRRPEFLAPGSDRLRKVVLRRARQLEIFDRTRAGPVRQARLLAARQDAGRLQRHQRHGVHPRLPQRLRRLGRGRQRRLGLARRPPRLPPRRGTRPIGGGTAARRLAARSTTSPAPRIRSARRFSAPGTRRAFRFSTT